MTCEEQITSWALSTGCVIHWYSSIIIYRRKLLSVSKTSRSRPLSQN